MTQFDNPEKNGTEAVPNSHGTSNFTIKNMADEDKPREKLMLKGKKELSNAELLAILIGSGTVGQSAVKLAMQILESCGNDLAMLSRMGIKDLTKDFKGMGEAKAITIIAAMELGYRMLNDASNRKEYYITSSMDLFNYIGDSLVNLPHEEFWAVFMNIKRKALYKQRISVGGLNDTAVDIRRIFATALEKNAVCIAVAHNHPSGVVKPSKQDVELTKRIAEAGKVMNIPLRDHLVVGINDDNKATYFSFFDQGMI